MDVATLGEQLLFTTVYLECKTPDGKTTGTGFVYAVSVEGPKGEKGVAHFLVTNRHVLDKADQISFQMVRKNASADRPDLGKAWSANFPGFSEVAWVAHPDPKIDVAVMSLGFIFNAVHQQSGDTPFFRAISPSVAMTGASSQELDAMEEVVFVGYPRGIFDSVNLLPVARRGTTASHPAVDYEGLPAFLIDASVFPGSSGSPVLIAQTGSYNAKSGGIVIGNRIVFMGVLAAVHLSPVIGEVKELPTAGSVAVSGIPMNLGIVYKAVAVEATIDAWLKVNKFRRAPEATSEPGQESEVDQAAATQTQEKVDKADEAG